MGEKIKGVVGFIRAIINAPDMQHWINKYEAAKRDNAELRAENERLRRQLRPEQGGGSCR